MSDYENYEDDENIEWDEFNPNENPLPEIDDKFRSLVLDTKHKIYADTIFINSDNYDNIINTYLQQLMKVHNIIINIQENGTYSISTLSDFNEGTRYQIQQLLEWISNFYKNNTVYDIIPYSNYLTNSFKVHPYVQSDNFDNEVNEEENELKSLEFNNE